MIYGLQKLVIVLASGTWVEQFGRYEEQKAQEMAARLRAHGFKCRVEQWAYPIDLVTANHLGPIKSSNEEYR